MRNKAIIGMLMACLLLISGCNLLDKTVCFEHDEIHMERTGIRDWRIPEGIFSIRVYICDGTNITNSSEDYTP